MTARPQFEVLTLFPDAVEQFVQAGLLGKAIERSLVSVTCIDIRDFAHDKHRTVDDAPFGGGPGMVMKMEPVVEALEFIERTRGPTHRVLLAPSGKRFDQDMARRMVEVPRIALVCGRYEGIDDRVRTDFVHETISLGDFVLNGGEVAALAIIEAVSRLREGVLGNPASVVGESFARDAAGSMLEYPQYTRPAEFRGLPVPPVLLSGDHGAIAAWRQQQATARTWVLRPDLRTPEPLGDHVPVYLALSGLQAPVGLQALATVGRHHGLAGLLLLGADSAPWVVPWAQKSGGRVPLASFTDVRTLRRRLRRAHGADPVLVAVHPDPGAHVPIRGTAALLDHLHAEGERRPVVLVMGDLPDPGGFVQFAPSEQDLRRREPQSLALPDAMIDPSQPWPARAAVTIDRIVTGLRSSSSR